MARLRPSRARLSTQIRSQLVPEGIAASDWANIRAVYQAQRYQVAKVNDGYRARNPTAAMADGF